MRSYCMEDGTCPVEVWVHSGYWGDIFSFYKKYTVQTWHPLFTQDGGWMAVVGRVPFPGVTTNSPLMQICLKFLQKSWNPLFSAPHPQSNKQTGKKKATASQHGIVHWMRSCLARCPPGICSLDRSCQALCSRINAARHCKVFQTCWSRFPRHAWGQVACTEGWRPGGDRKT